MGASPEPRIYPTVAHQAYNFARDMLAFIRSGGKLAPKPLRHGRLAACNECDQFDKKQKRCMKCGCLESAKVFILVAKCPLDKWPSIPA